MLSPKRSKNQSDSVYNNVKASQRVRVILNRKEAVQFSLLMFSSARLTVLQSGNSGSASPSRSHHGDSSQRRCLRRQRFHHVGGKRSFNLGPRAGESVL